MKMDPQLQIQSLKLMFLPMESSRALKLGFETKYGESGYFFFVDCVLDVS